MERQYLSFFYLFINELPMTAPGQHHIDGARREDLLQGLLCAQLRTQGNVSFILRMSDLSSLAFVYKLTPSLSFLLLIITMLRATALLVALQCE